MKLTPSQRNWLKALSKGRDPMAQLHGRSAHGGATGTWASLYRRGLIDLRGFITTKGREEVRVEHT